MKHEDAKCRACKWWRCEKDGDKHNFGLCTISPPSAIVNVGGKDKWKQPLTNENDNCGDFEDRETGERID